MLPDTVILSTIEIETLLSDIRGRLILHVRNDSKPDNADELFEWTLRFFGLMDLEDRSDLRQQAGDLAESIYALKDTTPTDHGKLISKSLDILSEIEATIVSSRSDDEPFDVDITSLLDASLIGSTPSSPEESLAAEDSFEGFEIDAELLEIFSEEADELLKSIEESLARLTSNPEDTDALWEIRRNAHTFKGASGVVGLNAASKISHRIEDLLDRFAEKEAGSGLPILELLQTAASCLRSMTTVDGLHPDADQLDRLNKSFDVALSRIEKVADEPAPIVQPEVIANPQSSVAKIDAEESSASGDRKRSIIRVPLEKLNELEAALHDLVVGSSAIERRLTDLDHQILELNNTTHRLKTTSGKIESGFEAEMLGKLSAFDVGLSTQVDDNDFDPLEFDRYTEFHENTRVLAETASDTLAVNTSLDAIRSGLETLFERQKNSIRSIQDALLKIRMVEFGTIRTRLQRTARVTADELGREVELTLINGDAKVDTQMLDLLSEPMMHLIRNAVVHGIEPPETRRFLGKPETGSIIVSFANEITHVVLTVSDDGSGIAMARLKERAVSSGIIDASVAELLPDRDAVNLVFEPGITTAEKLSMSAGRGIGMSIIKSGIDAVGGSINIESRPQSGTRMVIRIPLKISMMKAVVVRSNGQCLAIPSDHVYQVAYKNDHHFENEAGNTFMISGTEKLPVREISSLLFGQNIKPAGVDQALVVVAANGTRIALIVDEVLRTEELALKPLGRPLDRIKAVIGVAVTGNDEVLPILNVQQMILMQQSVATAESSMTVPETTVETILIVDDSPSVRHMTSKIVKSAGWHPVTARDGMEALHALKTEDELPAVILTDIEMPRMGGFDLIRALKADERLRNIPVVVITSRSGEKHRGIAQELGIQSFLSKPFNEDELVDTVRTFLKDR